MIQTKPVTLDPGESREVAFTSTPSVAKVHQVSVDGLTGSFAVLALPAEFEYSNVSCSKYYSPEESRPGVRWLDLRCTITNIGGAPDTRTITFCFWPSWAGKPITCYYNYETFNLTLQPGESFYYSSRDRGVYAPIGKDSWGYVWLHDNKGGESAKCGV